jgi:hypothetical protein
MSTTDDLRRVLTEFDKRVEGDSDLRELREFYEDAKREGIAKRPEYDLPQLDTIGRTLAVNTR